MSANESQQLDLGLQGTSSASHDDSAASFRPIHYLGSKLRLAPAIAKALDTADASRGTVLDLFAGSGTTAHTLAGNRRVIASDIQEYSRVLCSALLACSKPPADFESRLSKCLNAHNPLTSTLRNAIDPLIQYEQRALQSSLNGSPEPICEILERGSILAAERGMLQEVTPELRSCLAEATRRLADAGLAGSSIATATRYFGGSYFSYQQALELDCLSAIIEEISAAESKDFFTAALLSTASDVVNTVGKQFAQPIRPRTKDGKVKQHLLSKIQRDRRLSAIDAFPQWLRRYYQFKAISRNHLATQADYRNALVKFAGQYSIVYADPPYTRDHYSRFYHVLETLSKRDNPYIARSAGSGKDELSRGLYRGDRHQSPFCIRSKAADAFTELFRLTATSGANLVLSYSPFESGAHPRMMKIEMLLAVANEFYRTVELQNIDGINHSKLNNSKLNLAKPKEAEVLLICKTTR